MTVTRDQFSAFGVLTPDEVLKVIRRAALDIDDSLESLSQFGVCITPAELEAFAFRAGVICGVEFLDEARRTELRYKAIMEKL